MGALVFAPKSVYTVPKGAVWMNLTTMLIAAALVAAATFAQKKARDALRRTDAVDEETAPREDEREK